MEDKASLKKYVRKVKVPTSTNTSSTIPFKYTSILSASCKETVVGLGFSTPNLLKTEKSNKLILEPKSYKASFL
ncbi:hypothetical protein ACDT14_13560, partial [Staphylococcus aureus]